VRPDVAITMLSAPGGVDDALEASLIDHTLTGGPSPYRLGDEPLEVAALLGDQGPAPCEQDVGEVNSTTTCGTVSCPGVVREPCAALSATVAGEKSWGTRTWRGRARWHRCSFLDGLTPNRSALPRVDGLPGWDPRCLECPVHSATASVWQQIVPGVRRLSNPMLGAHGAATAKWSCPHGSVTPGYDGRTQNDHAPEVKHRHRPPITVVGWVVAVRSASGTSGATDEHADSGSTVLTEVSVRSGNRSVAGVFREVTRLGAVQPGVPLMIG
jgi:hypothetical protein